MMDDRRGRSPGADPPGPGSPSTTTEARAAANVERLTAELEFVQLLANPRYLNRKGPRATPLHNTAPTLFLTTPLLAPRFSDGTDLAQNNYFADPAFVNYLEYLKYWQDPRYAKLVV